MNIVTDSTGLIVMISDGQPTPPSGGTLYELTDAQEAERAAAFAVPNSGVMFDGSTFTIVPPLVNKPVVSATPAQFRLELADLGKLDAVEALIAAQVKEIQIRYEYATEFRSDSPLLLLLASHATINMTEQEVYDALLRASQRNIGV